MKKQVLVLCPLLLCVLLAACAGPSVSVTPPSVQPAETPNQILAGAREPSLRVEKQVYSMEDKEISYLLKNPTGKQLSILMIPKLERQEDMDWTRIECKAGFCGNADHFAETMEGSVPLEWFPELLPGHYRLSFELVATTGADKSDGYVSDEFTIE